MNFRLKCEKPESIEYTITATMTAGEWEQIRETLDKGGASYYGPAGKLVSSIKDMLTQARQTYWPTV